MWYNHQNELIILGPDRRLIAFGCGAGKTRTVLKLCEDKGGTTLVAAPKTQVLDMTWEREAKSTGLKAPDWVISKENFKKAAPKADNLVLDEGHVFLGVTAGTRYVKKVEIPRTSQIFDATYKYIVEQKPKRIYICSATPFPQPLALWAAGVMFGEDWDYFAFRRKFYHYVPSIGRGVWLPRRDKETEALLKGLAHKFGSFGKIEDFMDVPDQVFKTIHVGTTSAQNKKQKEIRLLYPEPVVQIGKRHQLEQGIFNKEMLDENKLAEIIELAKEFPKLLVFARYTFQVDYLAAELQKKFKKKTILVLDGRTIDRRTLLQCAEEKDSETIVVAQSQISTGYELPSYRCTVFASCSYSFIDYEQALGRTQRINNISKNVYVHLLAGDVDEQVLECVQDKKDFNDSLFYEKI